MSRIFGPMRQVGMVVRDIEAAMRDWTRICGIGPWFYAPAYRVEDFQYRGARLPQGPNVSIALAYSGEMQLELIQQRCDTPSLYRDFIAAGLEGMQHWAAWPEDYDAALAKALAEGWRVGHAGGAIGRGRFAYLESSGPAGTIVELVELTEARRVNYAKVRDAAQGWDGADPVRPL